MLIIKNPEEFRERICFQLQKKIHDLTSFPTESNFAMNLEKGIYNFAIKESTNRKVVKKWDNPFFVQIYVDHLRSIFLNLRTELLEKAFKGEIQPHIIASMSHQELFPEKWENMIQEKIKRDSSKYETVVEASTDTFTCRKCRSKKCTYYALQTRSADEPMTIFVTCIDCGNRFKC